MHAPDNSPTGDLSAEVEIKDALLQLADTKPLELCAIVMRDSVTFEFGGKTWPDRRQAGMVLGEELARLTVSCRLGLDDWHAMKEICARREWAFKVSYAIDPLRA